MIFISRRGKFRIYINISFIVLSIKIPENLLKFSISFTNYRDMTIEDEIILIPIDYSY